jgi:RNA polymerase sigma-70 factor (ECF subfamily)
MDESHLIGLAQQGDVDAFNRLVLHYQNAVYNIAYRLTGDGATADDVTQEAFISAYHAIGRFRGGSFKAWLLRIATNASYDELRRRKRRPQSSLDEIADENESSPLLVAENSPGPEESRQRAELAGAIQYCLDRLPLDQRTAAVLSDVEGYAYEEIAEIMRSSLGTVKSRISRARAKLRECLRGFAELLPVQLRLSP